MNQPTKLIQYLWYGRGQDRFFCGEDYDAFEQTIEHELAEVVRELLVRHGSATEIKKELERWLIYLKSYGAEPEDGYFFYRIAEQNPTLGCEVCRLLLGDPGSPLSPYLRQLLDPLRQYDKSAFLQLAREIMETKDSHLMRQLAATLGRARDLDDEEKMLVCSLVFQPDHSISRNAIRALRRFPSKDAFEVLMKIDTGNSEALADDICGTIDDKFGIPYSEVPDRVADAILEKLVRLDEISEHRHHIYGFVRWVASRDPVAIVEFFFARLRYRDELKLDANRRYQPIPFASFTTLPIGSELERRTALSKIRDRMIDADIENRYWLSHLFAAMSAGFNETSIKVLSEWLQNGDPRKVVCVGLLLREAEPGFVFTHEGFVEQLLDVAEQLGAHVLKEVRDSLSGSAASRGGSGIPGLPMPHDVDLLDKANKAAAKYAEGSPARVFYTDLKCHAESMIDWDLKLWEERED